MGGSHGESCDLEAWLRGLELDASADGVALAEPWCHRLPEGFRGERWPAGDQAMGEGEEVPSECGLLV